MIPLHPVSGRRFKPSGPNIPNAQRHSVKLEVRCSPELAAEARAYVAGEKGRTLAQVLEAGLKALGAPDMAERLAYERGHAAGYVAGRLAADEEHNA